VNVTRAAAIAIGALAVAAVLVAGLQRASTHIIVARGTLGYLPFVGDRNILDSANELLWERFGYGLAAVKMIKEHPISGIGVGTFHALVKDYGRLVGYPGDAHHPNALETDNAQMWWRHHIAELGLLGSVPLFFWCWIFGRQLFSRHRSGDGLSIGMLRAVLVGFFIASLFGMPAQSIAIIMTFWVFAFWFWTETIPTPEPRQSLAAWSKPMVIAAAAVIAIHAGATVVDAFGDLRPRERAQRFGWYYRYGFVQPDDVEPDPGGKTVGRRWTTKDALAVIPVKGRVLKFVAWSDHPDADVKPVHTKVWADSALIYEGDLKRNPLFLDIPATPGKKYLVLEITVDRLFRPSDSGRRDSRELGLSVRDWVWE
jgi:hypothetical protein